MNCQRVRDEIKAYIDGELGLIERWQVARHIRTCDACREEEIAMRKLTENLSETEQTPAPEGLRDRVMAELEHEGPSKHISRPWTAHPAFQFAALSLIVVVLAAVLFPVFTRARRSARSASGIYSRELSEKSKALMGGVMSPKESAAVGQPTPAAGTPLMIIKTAQIKVEVKRFQPAYDEAMLIAGSVGGYVTNSTSEQNDDIGDYGTVTLRVPEQAFDRTVDRLGRLGKVVSKHFTGEDVTGQVVDLESRLRNKRAEEQQYLEIMNRAKQVQDVVTVSNELFRVRGEIEEAQGRLKYLKSAVAMSTINVELREKFTEKPEADPTLWTTVTGAGKSLLGTLKTLAKMLIWLLVYSPIWAIPLAAWVILKRRAARG